MGVKEQMAGVLDKVDADGLEQEIEATLCKAYDRIELATEEAADEVEFLILDHWRDWLDAEAEEEIDSGLALALYTGWVKDLLNTLLHSGPLSGVTPEDDVYEMLMYKGKIRVGLEEGKEGETP